MASAQPPARLPRSAPAQRRRAGPRRWPARRRLPLHRFRPPAAGRASQNRGNARRAAPGSRFQIDRRHHFVGEGARSDGRLGLPQSLAEGGVAAEGLAQFGIALQALQQQIELCRRKFAIQAGSSCSFTASVIFVKNVTNDKIRPTLPASMPSSFNAPSRRISAISQFLPRTPSLRRLSPATA